jgi:sarcosine oxidase subunit gamma
MAEMIRASALGELAAPRGATLSVLPAESRFVFRGDTQAAELAGSGFGVALPATPCRSTAAGARTALWLGPDEWMLITPEDDPAQVLAPITAALGQHPHSLVDISHRDAGIGIEGPEAMTILNAACPLDLDQAVFPTGACTRTVFGKAGIVLWRTGAHRFVLYAARSFAPYMWRMLEEARREFLA